VIVASVDAPASVKALADYVCDGTADQVDVQAAVDKAAMLNSRNSSSPVGAEQRGLVGLTGGRFNFSAGVGHRTGVAITGAWSGTEVRAVSNNDVGLFRLANPADHLTHLSKMYLYGNYSSGGSCHGVAYDMSNSGNTSGYPSTNPDSYHYISDLYLDGFTGGTRNGIYLFATSTANNRGNIIKNVTGRNFSGTGIFLNSASDSLVEGCQIGTATLDGFRCETGNMRIANSLAFYCDRYGFYLGSNRGTMSDLATQDCATGIYMAGGSYMLNGATIDTCSADGLVIASSNIIASNVMVHLRGGGRYTTQTNGIRFAGTYSNLKVDGVVVPSGITTAVSGTTPSAPSFVRVPNGSTIYSVG
jgi:hypothetical protein